MKLLTITRIIIKDRKKSVILLIVKIISKIYSQNYIIILKTILYITIAQQKLSKKAIQFRKLSNVDFKSN